MFYISKVKNVSITSGKEKKKKVRTSEELFSKANLVCCLPDGGSPLLPERSHQLPRPIDRLFPVILLSLLLLLLLLLWVRLLLSEHLLLHLLLLHVHARLHLRVGLLRLLREVHHLREKTEYKNLVRNAYFYKIILF